MTNIKYFIQSLKKKERLEYIEKNKSIIPEMEIFESINGYDIDATIKNLKNMKLKYKELKFKTYGTLACFLTKVKAFQYQIKNNIQYMCLIEDDNIIQKGFKKFIESKLYLLKDCNMLRLSRWGDGYVTSLNGAKNIVENIYKTGIISNIDNQLRTCGEIKVDKTPLRLVCKSNRGDCLQTEKISPIMELKLVNLSY